MIPLEDRITAWSRGIPHELAFWDDLIRSRGSRWPEDWRARIDPLSPLDPFVAGQARALAQPAIRILDVGAGPLTCLGYRLPGVALEIVPTDPLAAAYAVLFARHGVTPPLPTRFAFAEDLLLSLPAEGFDLVHCRNALDHSYDPLRGIEQMLATTRIGGRVLLRHASDEAEREAYQGFHQHNITVRDRRLVVWNRAGVTDIAAALATPARVTTWGTDWVDAVIEKTGPSPVPPAEQVSARVATTLAAFAALLGEAALPPWPAPAA